MSTSRINHPIHEGLSAKAAWFAGQVVATAFSFASALLFIGVIFAPACLPLLLIVPVLLRKAENASAGYLFTVAWDEVPGAYGSLWRERGDNVASARQHPADLIWRVGREAIFLAAGVWLAVSTAPGLYVGWVGIPAEYRPNVIAAAGVSMLVVSIMRLITSHVAGSYWSVTSSLILATVGATWFVVGTVLSHASTPTWAVAVVGLCIGVAGGFATVFESWTSYFTDRANERYAREKAATEIAP